MLPGQSLLKISEEENSGSKDDKFNFWSDSKRQEDDSIRSFITARSLLDEELTAYISVDGWKIVKDKYQGRTFPGKIYCCSSIRKVEDQINYSIIKFRKKIKN